MSKLIKFNEVSDHYNIYKKDIDKTLKKILYEGQFILGKEVYSLENKLKNYIKCKYCISVSSGTDALLLSLLCLDVGYGDEIIVPPFTWISTVEVILLLGAKPVFVDIDKENLLIDPNLIETKITPRTKAIIFVSLYGNITNLELVRRISNKNNIYLIEDAAQSFGSSVGKKMSCNIADISCTSFFPSKALGSFGDGGAIFTNIKKFEKKIKKLRNHGQAKRNRFSIIGINGRLDTIQAGILLAKFKFFKRDMEIRKKIVEFYKKYLKTNENLKFVDIDSEINPNNYLFTIISKKRDLIMRKLQENNIETSIYYDKPVNKQFAYKKFDSYLPNANRAAKEVLSLPVNLTLKEKDIKRISNIINSLI